MNVFDPKNGMGNGITLEAEIYCYKWTKYKFQDQDLDPDTPSPAKQRKYGSAEAAGFLQPTCNQIQDGGRTAPKYRHKSQLRCELFDFAKIWH